MVGGKGSTELSLEERLEIERLVKMSCKTGTIASTLNRCHSCIKQEVRRNGGKSVYDGKKAHDLFLARKEARIRKIRKNISEEQLTILKKGIEEKWSINKIRRETKIHHGRIVEFFRENNISYIPKNYIGFETRIEALESQIEIIIEQMRRIYDKINENKGL